MSELIQSLGWLPLFSAIGAALGVLVSWKFPGTVLRERVHQWRPGSGFIFGVLPGLAVSSLPVVNWFGNSLFVRSIKTGAVVILAMLAAYFWSRRPEFGLPKFATNWIDRIIAAAYFRELKPSVKTLDAGVERMVFRPDWNIRPRFETGDEGLFVGRNELLGRLSSHFLSKSGGTILISGVRGVGKTALVDRALVDTRQKLADRYWENLAEYLEKRARIWRPIDMLVRRSLKTLGQHGGPGTEPLRSPTQVGEQLKRGAEQYPLRQGRFWRHFNLVNKRIQKMREASESQLFVLKFSSSDIGGALADPNQKSTGKPRMDPEKLLRSVIRKLHTTCHPSGPGREARILQWSLCNKKLRRAFFNDLQKAFDKSISKSYKEIISDSVNNFVKQQWAINSESKVNLIRIVIAIAVFMGIFFGSQWLQPQLNLFANVTEFWRKLTSGMISTIAGIVASYFTLSFTATWSRTSGSDSQRQAQFSYENDYSLARMQSDLESLMRTICPPVITKFNPYQCFTRSTIVFDELDKLDNAEKQLDDVITHFKNFFTLSNSVFVFLTDHQFYEHLNRETVRAQLGRYYSPQHTFFNEKIYLRKPEFLRFREAFYKFGKHDWIVKRAESLPGDPTLIGYLLLNGEGTNVIKSLPLSALTHLYVHKNEYAKPLREEIETAFERLHGHEDPMALAEIWLSQERSLAEKHEKEDTETKFRLADGWNNPEAVALLYYCRADFNSPEKEQIIIDKYNALGKPSLLNYESVKAIPFTLGDLAQALCFQTRNHYFDLYQFIYDYISEYSDGAPVVFLDDKRFSQETRLSSRYQRLIEIAFESVKENHPSREYFNGLLMESLYAVFDKRGTGQAVKVADILFQANGNKKPAKPAPLAKAATPDIAAFTARDVQKINQAIVRLVKLALKHKAISSTAPEFEDSLDKEDWEKLAELQFEWNDDVQSIIKVTDKEAHEHELISFWTENKAELEALETELARMWRNAVMPEDASRMHAAIRELRGKTESVRLASIKISKPDAEILKANVKTPEFRKMLMPKTILDRIRVEEDARIHDGKEVVSVNDRIVAAELESRKQEFESATGLPLQAVISPVDSDCYVFLTSAPAPDAEPNWPEFPKENDFVLWYAPTRKDISSDLVWFYFPAPGPNTASDLVDHYSSLATRARLQRLVAHLSASEYKDVTLAQRAGAEVMGYVGTGSDLHRTLSRPAVELAIRRLDITKKDFIDQQDDTWQIYQIDPPVSAQDATSKLAAYVAKLSINEKEPLTFNLTTAVEYAINQSLRGNIGDTNAQTWLKVFSSGNSRAGQFDKWVLEGIIRQLLDQRVNDLSAKGFETALHQDDQSRNFVAREFPAWLSQAIVDLASKKGIDLKDMLSLPEWAADLETERRSFRSNPLPAQPPQQTTLRQTLKFGRLKKRSSRAAAKIVPTVEPTGTTKS